MEEFRTETMLRTDVALNYAFKARARVEFFAQFQLLNAFNQFAIVDPNAGFVDLGVNSRANAGPRYEAFNPFTEKPVQGVHWDYSPGYGVALGAGAYNTPRTFVVSFGVRY
jgi:hypothetical protein